ncbi:MAG: sensor histidine kinase [Clostridia bacterium]|nr:sensor histidine kinase [Clostridia bacterium]
MSFKTKTPNIKELDDIIKRTLDTIEKSKQQIIEIAEASREECYELKNELELLKYQTKQIISEVDRLDELEKQSRRKLMLVSKNFKEYSEKDIKNAYNNAQNLQIQLALKRDKEQHMIKKRNELEKRLIKSTKILKKSEDLVTHVGVAFNFLSGNLSNISDHLEDITQKQILAAQIILAQEEERRKVARDIHDGPAQLMSNIVLKAELCEKLSEKDITMLKGELNNLKDLVRGCLKEVRKIIYDLRPMSLDDLGLMPTLERYINDYQERTCIDTKFNVIGQEVKLKLVSEVAIFRIIQEALNNIYKHSGSDRANIKFEFNKNNLILMIRDYGKGFIPEDVPKKDDESGGFGLDSMRQRVELLEGKFSIKSEKGKGTMIFINIPINSCKEE